MNVKIAAAVAVLFIVVIAALMLRRSAKHEELEALRAADERAARQHIDLSTLPPIEKQPEEDKPAQKFKKKPIVVEMKLKTKKGKAFKGHYQLMNAAGDIVGEDEAPPGGEPAVFIVSPGPYELIVPASKFRKRLTLVGDESGKMAVDVVIAAK